jgi:hypothetical protein
VNNNSGAQTAHVQAQDSTDAPGSRRAWLLSVLQHRPDLMARLAYFQARLRRLPRGQRRWLVRRLAVPISAVALMLALSAAPGGLSAEAAATIPVANNAVAIQNDGICSLIEAINNANSGQPHTDCVGGTASGADTIVLPAGGSFKLTAYDNYDYYGYNGLPKIASAVIFEGNGSVIERTGKDEFRLLAVASSGDLTLNDVTLRGGDSGYYYGGAIFVEGGSLALNDSTLTGNTADGGGALHGLQAEIVVSGSTLNGNESYIGGAIHVKYSDVTLTDSTISNNSGVEGFGGGAIYSVGGEYEEQQTGDLTITNTTISGNVNDGGGAVAMTYGVLELVDSVISNNSTKYGYGAGLYLQDVRGTISGTTISGNEAENYSGGGLAIFVGTVTISDSEITDNRSGYVAGGIYALEATVTLAQTTISGNASDEEGGGLYVYSGSVVVQNSTISDNTADRGGGLRNGGTTLLVNSTLSGNTARTGGGAANHGQLTLANATVVDNAATAGNGGGIANVQVEVNDIQRSGTLILQRSLISGNTAAGGAGPQVHSGGAGVTATANDHNIFGASGAAGVVGLTPGGTDIVPSVAVAAIIGGLASNGGPTQTHALVANSPAIDKGPTAACAVAPVNSRDQRGQFRSRNADSNLTPNECDIGAFEAPGENVSIEFKLFLPVGLK